MTDNALAAPPTANTSPPGRITAEAGRRRTFAVISHPDAGKSTLTDRSDRRGDQTRVLAAVGPMQFEVAVHRMATELSAPISLESLPYQVARIVDPADAEFMNKQVSAEVLTRTDGVMLVLFSTRWRLEGF